MFQPYRFAVFALLISYLFPASVLAEGLKGDEIKRLLIGNTLTYIGKQSGGGVAQRGWRYFSSETEVKQINDRGKKRKGSWSVTADGKICWTLKRRRGERCYSNVQVNGKFIRMEAEGNYGDRRDELLKGNPKGL